MNRYLRVDIFHDVLKKEKLKELNGILQNLGAKSVVWKYNSSWNQVFTHPKTFEPFFDENDKSLVFYDKETSWKILVTEVISTVFFLP